MKRRSILILAGAAALLLVVVVVFFSGRGAPLVRLEWERTIAVERLEIQTGSDWRDKLPAGAVVLSAEPRFHHKDKIQTGTRKLVVKVDGKETVEVRPTFDEKEVTMDWCAWEQRRWLPVRVEKSSGQGSSAAWPAVKLAEKEREGARSEVYRAVFAHEGKEAVVSLPFGEWSALQPGDRRAIQASGGAWTLTK